MNTPIGRDNRGVAIIRFDPFHFDLADPEPAITIIRIVDDQATAEHEVARLNHLNRSTGSIYFWQIVRVDQLAQSSSGAENLASVVVQEHS